MKTTLSKKFPHISLIFWIGFSSTIHAQVQEMKPTEKFCSKATALSQGLAEYIAGRMKVSVSSVRLIRAEGLNNGHCNITVDTAKGPQSCWAGSVYSNGKDFWVGGICY